MRTHARSLMSFAVALLLCACTPQEPIRVTNAWIRAPAPGTSVAVGYFDIVNRGAVPIGLIGARSAACATIEMHTHSRSGELMQMRRIDRVELPVAQPVAFATGGHHLMLLQFGDVTSPSIPVTLSFSDGSELSVPFELRSVTGANPS
jgi:periplasmic copper chaperone A